MRDSNSRRTQCHVFYRHDPLPLGSIPRNCAVPKRSGTAVKQVESLSRPPRHVNSPHRGDAHADAGRRGTPPRFGRPERCTQPRVTLTGSDRGLGAHRAHDVPSARRWRGCSERSHCSVLKDRSHSPPWGLAIRSLDPSSGRLPGRVRRFDPAWCGLLVDDCCAECGLLGREIVCRGMEGLSLAYPCVGRLFALSSHEGDQA